MAENGDTSPDVAKVIAAGTALVTGVGLLTVTGTLGRVQRNHSTDFAFALGIVLLGAGVTLVSPLISAKAKPIRRKTRTFGLRETAQGLGAALVVLGVLWGFVTAIKTA